MIGIFTANTDGIKGKFTLSFLIKLFTWYEFKGLIKNYPEKLGGCTFRDTPTHTLFGDIKCDGERRLIFESHLTQQLNYYYPCRWEFDFIFRHKVVYDPLLFHKVAQKTITQTYAILQLLYFVRRWFWCMPFKWLLPLWSKLFHGGKPITLWGNWFISNDICTEQCAKYATEMASKYALGKVKSILSKTNINNFSPSGILELWLESELWGETIRRI
jgi:hypothetical protein